MNKNLIGFIIGLCTTAVIVFLFFALGIFAISKNISIDNRIGVADSQSQKANYKPGSGYVPSADTAVRIAEAVWLPIYGKGIYNEKPFIAKLHDDIWTVTGTLPKGYLGGVAEVDISMADGKILRVIHGK